MKHKKEIITIAQYKGLKKTKKSSKFRSRIIKTPDGNFHSEWELKRWGELKMMLLAGEIKLLRRQVAYVFIVNEIQVAKYICDFEYIDNNGKVVVEDTKSVATESLEEFKIKKALMKALHCIEVKIILKPDYKYNGKKRRNKN